MPALPWISADALVAVPNLEADDPRWTPSEDVSSAPIRVTALTYRRDTAEEHLFLLAKRYEIPVAHAVPADELAKIIYRRTYERGFVQVDIVKTSWVDVGAARFFEVAWQFVHAQAGPVRKIERVAVLGETVYVLSAEGAPHDLDRHRATVLRWLDEGRFEGLEAAPREPADTVADASAAAIDELPSLLARADGLHLRGKEGEALELATAIHVRAHLERGDDDPLTIGALTRRGALLRSLGRLAASRELLAEAHTRAVRILSPEHPVRLAATVALADTLTDAGDHEAAQTILDAALAPAATLGAASSEHALVQAALGHLALLRRRHAEAERLLQSALTSLRAELDDRLANDPQAIPNGALWRVLHDLGRLAGESGKLEAAEPFLTAALDGRRRSFGDAHPESIESFVSLGTLYLRAKEPKLADPVLRKALEASRLAFGPAHPAVADRLVDVAMTCNALGAAAVVEPLLMEALAIRTASLGPDHAETRWAEDALASLRTALAARRS